MFLFSITMGAPLRALRGRSAINTINIITVFIFWGEEYRSLYRGLQSWYGGSLTGRSVRRHPTSTIVIEFFGVRLLHVSNTVMQECFFRSRSVFKIFLFRISLSTSQIQMFYHSSPCFTYIHTYIYIYLSIYKYNLFDVAGYKIQATNYSWCGAA